MACQALIKIANRSHYFDDDIWEIRENSVHHFINEFTDIAAKLIDSDDYQPTEYEQEGWGLMLTVVKDFQTEEEEQDAPDREILLAIMYITVSIRTLYSKFNGRVCENGEPLACNMD